MTYQLIYRVDLGSAQSPFRVIAQPTGREVGWINRFLDQCCVRGLAWHTLRDYAFALMQFVRWWADRRLHPNQRRLLVLPLSLRPRLLLRFA